LIGREAELRSAARRWSSHHVQGYIISRVDIINSRRLRDTLPALRDGAAEVEMVLVEGV
jgi:hypothetical protein